MSDAMEKPALANQKSPLLMHTLLVMVLSNAAATGMHWNTVTKITAIQYKATTARRMRQVRLNHLTPLKMRRYNNRTEDLVRLIDVLYVIWVR